MQYSQAARTLLISAMLLLGAGGLRAQSCVNVSTGFDQDTDTVLGTAVPDDDYTITLLGAGEPAETATTVPDEWPIAEGVWLLNDERSRWIGFNTFQAVALPGIYVYEIVFFLPAEVDASKAVLVGQWAADDNAVDIVINETTTGRTATGFGTWAQIPADTGLGLFFPGFNTIQFHVSNGGEAGVENPSGLRVEACVEVPPPIARPNNLSTGFDEGAGSLLADGAADESYTVEGPAGSGIQDAQAVSVPQDGFPIPPWMPASVNSRWIGLDTSDSTGPPGSYTYVTVVVLPVGSEPERAVLRGGMTAAGSVDDVLINGVSTGLAATDPTILNPFPVGAGQGLFTGGDNTVEFVVSNEEEGPTGLRVDGEVIIGPPLPEPRTADLDLDTGYDEESGATIPNGASDDGYVILGPPGSDVGPALAPVVQDGAYPIPPWAGSSSLSKWIGPATDSNGPQGIFTYVVNVRIPPGFNAAQMRLVGTWGVDNTPVDVIVNGTSTGISNAAGFEALTPFPLDAGLGLLRQGDNTIRFLVDNTTAGPTGLRVEAVLGVEAPRPRDLSSGVGVRGEGPFPAGFQDRRYRVVGPTGSGIGPWHAVVLDADGLQWVPDSDSSRWVGLSDTDPVGPQGTYKYSLEFTVPPELNPLRLSLAGRWAASPVGGDVLLNGVSLGVPLAVPGELTEWPPDAGKGLIASGRNTLELLVENEAEGPTGLRVEALIDATPRIDPLDISTAFEQFSGEVLNAGSTDDDYTMVTPALESVAATVVSGVSTVWISPSPTSGWIGLETAASDGDPGTYIFGIHVTLSDEEATKAVLEGGWAVDDRGVDVLINGTSTGLLNESGYGSLALFPEDFGQGLFLEGDNTVEFVVVNEGTTLSPVGLRVDARIATGMEPGGIAFHRGDATGDGAVNITDGIYILNYLFLAGPSPGCLEAANPNDDGAVNITDGIYLLNHLFLGGPPPDPPGFQGPCGPDPVGSSSDLGCIQYNGC